MRRMSLLHRTLIILCASLLALGFAAKAWATDVTLRLVDQNGALIPASQFQVLTPPGGNVQNGGTISLPEGVYTIRLFPGLNGAVQPGHLYRDETISASGSTQTEDFVWLTATLQLNLVDQNNVLILQSQIAVGSPNVGFIQTLSNASSVILPVTDDANTSIIEGTYAGGYPARLFPGLDGKLQGGQLYRDDPAGELTAAGLVKTFIWVTATLQLNLVDQNNTIIPQSQIAVGSPNVGFIQTLPNASSVILPVTDDANTSIIEGTYAGGYPARLFPGLDGKLQGGQLYRDDPAGELTAAGLVKTFIWVTATLQLNLVDQNNTIIPQSQIAVGSPNVGFIQTLPNASSVILPVTDDANTSILEGTYADGYPARLFPGLDGKLQGGQLYRDEPAEELLSPGFIRVFVWEISKGTLHVVNATEAEVNGSSIRQGFLGTINTGTCFSLPITDNAAYPTIAGRYANGYDDFYIQTASANPFEGPFTFKFLSNKIIDPAFVTLASGQHGLRFDLMTPTALAAHAGSDQTINAGQAVQIGGSPTATGGSGSYTISWSPEDGLDDPSAANPMASPASTTIYTVTITDNAMGCQATDEVTVQVNHVDPIKPFVFLANKITLKRTKQSTPTGDMHANGVITIEKGDPSTYNSNLTAVGNVVIQKDNTINGNVKSATKITNQGKINGTPSIAPVNNEPLPSKSFSAGGANRTVPKNGTLSLLPGSYGVVTLNNSSTLKLTSGDYFLNELRYSSSVSSAVIEIDLSSRNPVTINVVSNLQLGNEVEIRLLPNGESDSELVTFFTLQNSAMKLGREAYLLGSFNAPNALVTLEKNSQLRGAICAKELLVERDCLFLHHDSPGSLPGPGDLPKSSSDDDEQQATSNEQPVTSYQLAQNYPNPFNPSTKISFALPEASEVTLAIYNNSGQLVRMLISGQKAAGRHSVVWDAKDGRGATVASGVYLYMLKAGNFVAQRKLVLMK
ncbi:T9SS type A sorting domain-containing protein [bacterium]|nr:T9SS type A sorting domain-containing protein [bacterium]